MSKFVAIPLTATEQRIVTFLKENGPATCKEIGVSLPQVKALMTEGAKQYVQVVDTRKHVNPETGQPQRGRPEFVVGLNKRGRDKARRMVVAA